MSPLADTRFDIETQDIEYLRHGDAPLLARLYLPRGAGPFPVLVDVHGGAWCRGTRLDEERFNEALARRGVAVMAIDFRMPPDAGYPASLADIHFAVRWAKSQAALLRTRPGMVGLFGLSSGAHQAMLAAMRPGDPRYAALPLPDGAGSHDARPAAVVLCWPVIDPLGRYHHAKAAQASGQPYPEVFDRVIPDHDRYWPDEAAMAEGNPVRALERGERVELPPVLVLQGDADLAHPRAHLDRFVTAYRQAGGELCLRLVPGEAEGFVNKKPDAPVTAEAADAVAHFARTRCGA